MSSVFYRKEIMEFKKLTERCRIYSRIHFLFSLIFLVSNISGSTLMFIISLGLIIALSFPVYKYAKCPKCGRSFFGSYWDPFRNVPYFKLIFGYNVVCSNCKKEEEVEPEDQESRPS